MLVAQLYLQSVHFGGDWEILPTPGSNKFIDDMMGEILSANSFPKATPIGHIERVAYLFRNRLDGRTATLSIEDRPGLDYENLDNDMRQRLCAASALMLLFDPHRDRAALKREVTRTLQSIYTARGTEHDKDPRPYAVCLSKADTLLQSADDFEAARSRPREFVLERIEPEFVGWLERFVHRFQLFPVSSVGVKILGRELEPVVFFDEQLRLRLASDAVPLNLIEPFTWLLEQLDSSVPGTVQQHPIDGKSSD